MLLLYRALVLLAGTLLTAAAAAWGPQGHRVAGALAETGLSAEARREVRALLGDESLAQASTWADRMRGHPSEFWQRTAGPYHYVTVPPGRRYEQVGAPAQGDAVTALNAFRSTLEDPDASRARRQLALRFAVHIIQDLHVPLHVGNGRDRGGNDVKLWLDGARTNLHRIWDSAILSHGGRSDAQWIEALSQRAAEQPVVTDPLLWIAESAALRERIYPQSGKIDAAYLQRWQATVEARLHLSAQRTAGWLNQVFSR